MRLRVLDRFPDLTTVHYAGPRGVWATSGREILHSSDTTPPTRFAAFPHRLPNDLFGIGRLPRRLLRSDKCNLWPTRTGRLLGIRNGEALRFGSDGEQALDVLFEINGDCIMNRAIAEDPDGNLYFGEYFTNSSRIPVRIWRIDPDLEQGECVYTFDEGRIRHVHAIHSDPYDPNRFWVTTGDFGGECLIAYSDDRFETLHVVGTGSQLWRSVGLLFQPDRIGWLTDTHIDQNYVVSLARGDDEPVTHARLDNSSWYIARTKEGPFLATTTVEPGPGIKSDRARLLASNDGIDWSIVAEFKKDPYPMRGFGFGSLSLPSGELSTQGFWLSGEGLVGLDGQTLYCALEHDE